MKTWLYGKTLDELRELSFALGLPVFAARQIVDWLYKKQVVSIEAMTNLSARNRELLVENYEVGEIRPVNVQTSADGTKKYLFPTRQGRFIESAYIPDGDRATLCVSSQAGCRMGCRFCATAGQGFQHHLTVGEILNQIRSLPEHDTLTNVVYMGMGEPLDNPGEVLKSLEILTAEWGYGWSPTRITLSTIGILPALNRFLSESKVHLAVSLHDPFPDERQAMMPAQNAYPLQKVIETIKKYDFSHQRRVSFEYIVFEGVNDSPRHVKELVRLLSGLKCRVNLIRFHNVPDAPYRGAGEATMVRFRDALSAKGVIATIRASRGEDIAAACGLLSTREKVARSDSGM
jgi:23S rRNA (adenine2503-C2)-methyltransferase